MPAITIKRISKDLLKKRNIPYDYTARGGYDVSLKTTKKGWCVKIIENPDFHMVKTNKTTYRVIEHYKGESEVYLAYIDKQEAGLLQIEHQTHNNSLRIWDIYVHKEHRKRGVGTALMNRTRERATELEARRIILETQSCNMPAVTFYRKYGFQLAGVDVTNYSNDDIKKREVRLEMAYYL